MKYRICLKYDFQIKFENLKILIIQKDVALYYDVNVYINVFS